MDIRKKKFWLKVDILVDTFLEGAIKILGSFLFLYFFWLIGQLVSSLV